MRKIALVALCACFVGLTHLCSGADFQVLDERYTQAENQYKTALSKIESVLEKTKATKSRADEAKSKAIAAAKKAIAKNKEANQKADTEVSTSENAKAKEGEYMAATFKVMEISDDAKSAASKASAELNKAKSIKSKVDNARNRVKPATSPAENASNGSEGINTVALSKFETAVKEYEVVVKSALE